MDRYGDTFNREINIFVDAIEQEKQFKDGFKDGKQALKLTEAETHSILEKRKLI